MLKVEHPQLVDEPRVLVRDQRRTVALGLDVVEGGRQRNERARERRER
jgi:hypothetical protein